jgi:hypothetical protein
MTRRSWTSVLVAVIAVSSIVIAFEWPMGRPGRPGETPAPAPVVPAAFLGNWLEAGSECGDAASEARIGGSTVNFDRLSFIADRAERPAANRLLLVGHSYDGGETKRETVSLELGPGGGLLRLQPADFDRPVLFKRCP